MSNLFLLLLAYLLGAVPFGFLLVKWRTGQDVRFLGSGNIGATNVLRTAGFWLGLLVLLADAGKGFLAVWLAGYQTGQSPVWMSAAALAAMAGNAYSVFLKFQGGKAMATFVGSFVWITPLPMGAGLIVFVVTALITRHVSAGSVLTAISFPLAVWLISHPPVVVIISAIAAGALVLWRHKENIQRLRADAEHVFSPGGRP